MRVKKQGPLRTFMSRVQKNIIPLTLITLIGLMTLMLSGGWLYYLMLTAIDHITLLFDLLVLVSGLVLIVLLYAVLRVMAINIGDDWKNR